ncbi:MAG TPA: ABC transporter permease [Roseiflexaceae bacterium]|nr:ABC transporter permease [Roseiflexaceae bacterium]
MFNLISAEWLKLTRRPLVWVLLAVFLGLLALQILTQFALVAIFGGRTPGPALATQLDEWRRRSAFPGLFGVVFNHINGLGGIFAVVLAAAAMGSEYGWGTLRTQLARQPARARLLLAKVVTLLALLAVASLLALALGVALGAALGALTGGAGRIAPGDLARIPLALGRALFVLLPYVLLTLCLTIAGRSLLVGLAGGLLYLVFEVGFGALALFRVLGGPWRQIYNLTIGQNINTLALQNSHAFGLRPEQVAPLDIAALPPPPQAALVIAVYCALLLATATWWLRAHDVFGPS